MSSSFETLWEAFVEEQRRVQAPEELHRRVRAAIRRAAEVGSWAELQRQDSRDAGDVVPAARPATRGDARS